VTLDPLAAPCDDDDDDVENSMTIGSSPLSALSINRGAMTLAPVCPEYDLLSSSIFSAVPAIHKTYSD